MSPMPGYEQLISRLKKMRRRAIAFEWFSHLSVVLAILGTAFVVISLGMLLSIPSIGLRITLLTLLGLVVLGVILWGMAKSTIWAPRFSHLALSVERVNPVLKNRLIASLQLADRARANPEHYSLELVDLTIQQAVQISQAIDFEAALDRSRIKRSARWAGIGLGAALLLTVLFPGLAMRSWDAFSHPLTDYAPPIPYDLSVQPGSVEAVKFDDFKIIARVSGTELPQAIEIYHRTVDGDWRRIGPVSPVPAAQPDRATGAQQVREFHQIIPQIKHDFEYYVTAGERQSPTFTVKAVDRPRVTGLRLEVFPPRYTGIEPQVIDENDGTISAPVGTKVKIRLECNRRLSTATIVYSDGAKQPLEIRGRTGMREFTVDGNRSYHFLLVDESGRTNPHPIEYPISAIPDREPSVEIVLPGHNQDLDDNMAVEMKIVAHDDYGFSKLVLHTQWVSGGRERAVREFPIAGAKQRGERLELGYFWDLANWGMLPEDIIHYYVEVTDNDRVTGPKSAKSRTYTVRLPSLDEMIAEFEDQREADLSQVDRILQGEWEMSKKIQDLRRELTQNKQIDWETQKNLKDVAARTQELDKKLDDIAQQMQEQIQQAQQQKLQSVEMLQKMSEAQQLFQEVATEEMKEAMRKLQEALNKLDPKEVQQALKEMDLSTEEMIKRLDRTLAYLRRLQAEQKVDAFVRRLEDMVKQQESINNEVKQSANEALPDIAPSEERLKNSFEELAKDMAAAESLLTANKVADAEKINQFCQSASQSPAPQQMQQTAGNMKQKNQQGAEQAGGKSAESLQALLDEMKEFQSQMASKIREQMARELRRALDKVFYLSDQQENLLGKTEQVDANSMALREMAAEQEALRAATERLTEEVDAMAKKSTCISGGIGSSLSQSLSRMQSSAQALSDRRGALARNTQRDALTDLNAAAQSLVKSMDKNSGQCNKPGMCDKPGKAGAMARMQALSRKQGRINQQMPGGDQFNGTTMSLEERQKLARLKAEQKAVEQGVESIQSEIGDKKNLLGRLDKLAEEMKRVIEDMERSDVTAQTLERQRRIYTRMLDFQHSLKKQDYKNQRKAQFGQNVLRRSPGPIDAARGLTDEEYERLLTRYQQEGYPKEYEETIKEYFRALVEARGK